MDCGFPHLVYSQDLTIEDFGHYHGETFKDGIKELSSIRKNLMLQKSPHLKNALLPLAKEQWELTEKYFPKEAKELKAISEASSVSITDLVILNNYTDFRDINLPEEGCSTVGLNQSQPVCGQTWDMHSSAKDFICTIERPGEWITFSLVGCLGMMGANRYGLFIGVNNINTKDANPGVLWPAFIRNSLSTKTIEELRILLKDTPFTGAHNYLISDGSEFEHWEASPTRKTIASSLKTGETGVIYHTNHCLSPELKEIEETLGQNSTSKDRFQLLEAKKNLLKDPLDLINLLQDHTGYPKSLCGHFQSGAQDPSITCGGGVFDHETKGFFLWRGCKVEDKNYAHRTLKL